MANQNQYIPALLALISKNGALFFKSNAKDEILKKHSSLLGHPIYYPSQQPVTINIPFSQLIEDVFQEYEFIEFLCTNEKLNELPNNVINGIYFGLDAINTLYTMNNPQNVSMSTIQQEGIKLYNLILAIRNIQPSILTSYALNKLDYSDKGIANLRKISEEANASLEHIRNVEKQSTNKLTIITQATLTNKFADNAEQLKNSMNRWLIATYVSGGILLLVYVILFISISFSPFKIEIILSSANPLTTIIAKAILTFPVIYLFIFASRTYAIQKRLYEEYTFKVVMASSLESYLEIVDKVEKGNTDAKYRDFLIASIDKIFTSPNKLAFNHKSAKDDGEMNMSELQTLIHLIKDVDKTTK